MTSEILTNEILPFWASSMAAADECANVRDPWFRSIRLHIIAGRF